ncbi:hypothetical protein KBF38_22305, partial [bacterium]|nr:hypothetical protein [bacterium]
NSDVTVATGATVSGGTTTVTTPSLVVNGTGIVRSTGAGADLQISSNAPGNVLNVALNGPTSTLQSNTGNVNFNTPGAPGAITVTGGPANGVIAANTTSGEVIFNGGSGVGAQPVNVNVGSISDFCTRAFGSNVSVTTANGDLKIEGTSTGSFSAVANGVNANVITCGDIISAGILTLDAGSGDADVVISNTNKVQGSSVSLISGSGVGSEVSLGNGAAAVTATTGDVTITTPVLNMTAGANSVSATLGDVLVQSNGAGNALAVNLGAGSQINAATAGTGDIFFNPTTAGNISVTGGPANGLLNAGNTVSYGGGTVTTDVNQINGCVVSNGATVSTASVTTATGDLNVGPFTSSGNTAFTANAAGADLITCGDINTGAGNLTLQAGSGADADVKINNNVTTTGVLSVIAGAAAGSDVTLAPGVVVNSGSATITTPTLALGANSQLNANTGNLTVDSNAPGNALNVTLGANSTLLSATNVNFNPAGAANEGPITVTGAAGSLVQAPNINYNVGPSDLNISVGELRGCNNILGASGNPTSVGFVTQAGIIDFCTPINTSNPAGNGGPINITANGGAVNLGGFDVNANGGGAAGNGGSINISGAGGIAGGGNITSNGSGAGTGNGGPITLTAPGTNNITVTTIQSNGGATGGNGGVITTNSSNLSVTGIGPGGASISANGNGPGGNGGTVSITTTSTNPFVAGNPFPNGTASGISANGSNNGGTVAIASNGATVDPGVTVSANGTTGNGGVVTFDANNPANPLPIFNINGTVSAIGGVPGTGVVGIGSGVGQNLALTVGGAGAINAGQQITIGNIDPNTGLASGAPAGILFVSPLPLGPFPQAPFNSPAVVFNGTLFIPPPPPVPTVNNGGGFNLFAFLLGLNGLNNPDAQLLGLRIPTDLTRVFSRGKLNQTEAEEDENEEIARQKRLGKQCGLIEGSRTYVSNFDSSEQDRLAKEDIGVAVASTGGSNFTLNDGNVLFAPDKDITVTTSMGKVFIPSGAMVFVMSSGGDVAIYDLHQTRQDAVHVVVDKKLVTLDPGRLLVLTNQQTRDFERVASRCRCIGYRNPKEEDINADIKAFGMDFSLPSIISNVVPLRQMMEATSGPDKIAMDKILKNSALLMDLTASAGPFKDGN